MQSIYNYCIVERAARRARCCFDCIDSGPTGLDKARTAPAAAIKRLIKVTCSWPLPGRLLPPEGSQRKKQMICKAVVLFVCWYMDVKQMKKLKENCVFASQSCTWGRSSLSLELTLSQSAGFQLPPNKSSPPVSFIPTCLFGNCRQSSAHTRDLPSTLESVHTKCTWRDASDNMDTVAGNHSH